MTFYEHVFMARPEISPQRAQTLIEEFSGLITAKGGSIGKKEYWGLYTLAYPIKKSKKAHYMLLDITADHEVVGEMEQQMKLHEDVLRFLTVRVEEHSAQPSIQMQRKEKSWDNDGGDYPRMDSRENYRENYADTSERRVLKEKTAEKTTEVPS